MPRMGCRGKKLLLITCGVFRPFDDAFPDVAGAVFIFDHQPVPVVEHDIGSSHETHLFASA